MKVLPVLIITNLLALGLVLVLFVEQQDLKTQLSTARAAPAVATADTDAAADKRFNALERRFAALLDSMGGANLVAEGSSASDPALPEESQGSAGMGLFGDSADGEFEPLGPNGELNTNARMESFRRQVRQANRLNDVADRRESVEKSIDKLIAESRIGSLTDDQKSAVTGTLMAARSTYTEAFRKFREDPTIRDLPREERWQSMREQMAVVRDDVKLELEKTVPAADAEVILETALRDATGGMGGRGMPGGGRGRR